MLYFFLFSLKCFNFFLVLVEKLFDLLVLSRILNDRISNKLLDSFLFVQNLEVDLFVFELVTLFHKSLDGLVGLLKLVFALLSAFVLG